MFFTSSIRANVNEAGCAYRFIGAGILGSSLLHIMAMGGIVVLWRLDLRFTAHNIVPVELVMVRDGDGSSASMRVSATPQASQSVVGNATKNSVPAKDAAADGARSDYAFQAALGVTNHNITLLRPSQAANGAGMHVVDPANVINLLRAQVERCWFPPSAAPPPKEFGIDLHIVLSIDGSIAEPPKLIASGSGLDNDRTQAFIEAAQRAIYTCGPYKLPAAEFSLWHEVDVPRFFPVEK